MSRTRNQKHRTLKRMCVNKECVVEFIAKHPRQKYHNRKCERKANKKVALKRNTHDPKYIAKREAEYKEGLKFLNDPDNFIGDKSLADFLNIGTEELRYMWRNTPKRYKQITNKNEKGVYRDSTVLYYNRNEIHNWCEENDYWDLKAPVVKNYKEPLKSVPKNEGYGFYGAITGTRDGNNIQCHICGKFFVHLPGHLKTHNIIAKEYKEKFQLALTTPLSSDNHREMLKMRQFERLKNMSPEERKEYSHKTSKRLAKYKNRVPITLSLETKNKRGTCPDQIIDQIRKCADELGHTPSKRDFIVWCKSQRFVHHIYKTFGSWSRALEIAKLDPAPPNTEVIEKGARQRRYDDEELLEYLVVFYENTGKTPTRTDWMSHNLPNYKTYLKRFGGIRQARELAGLPQAVNISTRRKGVSMTEKWGYKRHR